jgi:hypothetical protein
MITGSRGRTPIVRIRRRLDRADLGPVSLACPAAGLDIGRPVKVARPILVDPGLMAIVIEARGPRPRCSAGRVPGGAAGVAPAAEPRHA